MKRTPTTAKVPKGYRYVRVGSYLRQTDRQYSHVFSEWMAPNSWGYKCITPHTYIRRRTRLAAGSRKGRKL